MDHFKFELIRASAAQEITHSRSTKFAAVTAVELVDAFIDFALGCGYERDVLTDAFAAYIDDAPQQYCLEAMDPPEAISKSTSNPSQIRTSLVEQVAAALAESHAPVDLWYDEARAAIREVAAWLDAKPGGTRAAWMLTQEADRTPISQED
jgi:hypothetical protein